MPKKTTMTDFRYKSLRSRKIDNIDLTQQLSLPIFTDFRYQSIKITCLLPIRIRITPAGVSRYAEWWEISIPWGNLCY